MKSIAIVGAGISGVAAAHYAQRSGWDVDLYEAQSQIGGRIGCTKLLGRDVEFGGKNIGLRYRRFREFAADVGGISFEEFGFNSSREVDGRVARLNKDGSILRTVLQLHRLCGSRGLLQLLPHSAAILLNRDQGFLNTPFFNALGRRGDGVPLSAHFSSRCVNHFIRTLTVRMNAAEPEECYLGNFGSNLGLALDRYQQVDGGMGKLLFSFQRHTDRVHCLTDRHVVEVVRRGNETMVSSRGEEGEWQRGYDHVVIALSAPHAARLLAESAPQVAVPLGRVRYFPVAVAVARYGEPVFTPKRRAMVFGPESPLSNAGAYGIHDLDLVRYTFSGQTARQVIRADTAGEFAMELAEKQLLPHFPAVAAGCRDFAYRYIPTGLCAYSAHHAALLDEICRTMPEGISLVGDYWRGASIEACFRASEEVLGRLSKA
ncbi:FAD-dependent oxidoreductase [Endothiovibrio diazotrophicus]